MRSSKQTTCLKEYTFRDDIPTYSIVMPIYNQEDIIVENLQSIFDMTEGLYELILVLDFCFDQTEPRVLEYFHTKSRFPDTVTKITIFKNEFPLFETKCDNIGFRHSIAKYCLEIQADMKMTERGYNLQLTRPFEKYPNVIAVSGRCSHAMYGGLGIGKLGNAIETPIEQLGVSRNIFYVNETCNRGPLLLDRQKLKDLGYLDEETYFLNNSDHDLMARAWIENRYICGYVPINFSSPLVHGSTRNTKTYEHCNEYRINALERKRLESIPRRGLEKYFQSWIRRLPYALDL